MEDVNKTNNAITFIEQQTDSISIYWRNETIVYIFKENIRHLKSLHDVIKRGKFIGSLTKEYAEQALTEYNDIIKLELSIETINLILFKQNEYLSKFRNACLLLDLHYPEYYEKNDIRRS